MQRGVSPVVGVLLATALTVAVAGATGVVVLGYATAPSPHQPAGVDQQTAVQQPVSVSASVSVDGEAARILLRHESGPPVDVRELTLRVAVGDELLRYQPEVPFYSLPGYASFPSGPFNPSADPRWELGEAASLTVTGDNAAPVEPGVRVRVELYRGDRPLATAQTRAR